jgi:chemotaxis protein CheC
MYLKPYHIDALRELVNIGVGQAAGVLNQMLRSHIRLQVPHARVLSLSELKEEMEELGAETLSAVQLMFNGPSSGIASLAFPTDSAVKFVDILVGEESGIPDFDSIKIGTLTEVGNIVLNGVMGSIGNILNQRIGYSVPTYIEDSVKGLLGLGGPDPSTTVLWAQTRFTIEQYQITGDVILLFEMGSLDVLLATIDRELGEQS